MQEPLFSFKQVFCKENYTFELIDVVFFSVWKRRKCIFRILNPIKGVALNNQPREEKNTCDTKFYLAQQVGNA